MVLGHDWVCDGTLAQCSPEIELTLKGVTTVALRRMKCKIQSFSVRQPSVLKLHVSCQWAEEEDVAEKNRVKEANEKRASTSA